MDMCVGVVDVCVNLVVYVHVCLLVCMDYVCILGMVNLLLVCAIYCVSVLILHSHFRGAPGCNEESTTVYINSRTSVENCIPHETHRLPRR